MIHKTKVNRHYLTEQKTNRKIYIIRNIWNDHGDWVTPGRLRKGKIHCSCPMCASKTNTSINRSKGPVCQTALRRSTRIPTTSNRYNKNWPVSDRKKIDAMLYQIKDLAADA